MDDGNLTFGILIDTNFWKAEVHSKFKFVASSLLLLVD